MPFLKSRNINVQIFYKNDLPSMLSDWDKFIISLFNFVQNATKYNKTGGDMIFVVGLNNSILEVDIVDTGIGIERHRQSSLFKQFGELNKFEKSKDHSIGVGLACSREIITQMGGKAYLKHSDDGLTVFTMEISVKIKPNNEKRELQVPILRYKKFSDQCLEYLGLALDYQYDSECEPEIDEDDVDVDERTFINNNGVKKRSNSDELDLRGRKWLKESEHQR